MIEYLLDLAGSDAGAVFVIWLAAILYTAIVYKVGKLDGEAVYRPRLPRKRRFGRHIGI